ncbi:(p)ppGpp synthetase [Clostridium sp. NSJ-6]|uniref:(P)ppGpp synthetase n=1 Tax=Clostridium hominis TaxID=2763036 RepID=A0ABR7DDE4_9CLOT|nr:(p)ppGpp synthetase [Clostridium hominis]MBC5629421.1 (p)ppGpp synthetase [Clostridium hominis]
MSIKEFEYLDIAINELNDKSDFLEECCIPLEEAFSDILSNSACDFTNISCRVKSSKSLKEKILRNRYYKKFPDANQLIYNLSDLIGIRIECKFGDDEKNIYRFLKKYFNRKYNEDYFFNEKYTNILLKLSGKQPQKQKNGFTIYRLDGKYIYNDITIPFELQIKSLVNMFWGEIEHQIIYKNSHYIIEDQFLKDLMNSIKNSLTMIDKQLLTVLNHVESKKNKDSSSRKKHLEEIVSKLIYDLFSRKMKDSINMIIDFKDSCETIVRYTFFADDNKSDSESTEILINALNRLNQISDEDIDFDSDLNFERKPVYNNSFSKTLGKYFEGVLNTEFSWNLFFRILFALEPLNNVGDFEKFLSFLKLNYTESKYINKQKEILINAFNDDFNIIDEAIQLQVAKTLISIDKIDIVYDYNIAEINDAIEYTYKYISDNINSIDEWNVNSHSILESLTKDITDSIE